MLNYLLNLDALNKIDLNIIYYSPHQFSLRLIIVIGI
ncbi:hypothetical protein EV194_101612 [Natronoflexus pectinivorans]|uniref:Uncharacterized protein n=1 Tax=Natronoflexus pectinivorans TaxID=682526 RepID=A0A4R2GPK3_9BACT|nr:hypothetical protein EV194_101612 [Natronoflexus pectinivorans]